MLLDSQEIFKTDDAVRKQFVLTDLLYLVRGAGVAGIKGSIFKQGSTALIPNAEIRIEGTSKSTQNDEDGKYSIIPVAAGFQEKV